MKFSLTVNFPGLISDYKKNDYSFYFRPMSFLLRKYGDVQVNIPNESSIMTVSLEHSNPQKAGLYLNSLMQNYLAKGIERENQIAQRTIDFIDSQVSTLVDSLQLSEQKLEDFRSTNKLVDIDYQAQQAYLRQNELERQKAELTIQKRYLEYPKEPSGKFLNVDELIGPTTLGISGRV
jgi:capsule polysaccharide export protein KpsE/RkpR